MKNREVMEMLRKRITEHVKTICDATEKYGPGAMTVEDPKYHLLALEQALSDELRLINECHAILHELHDLGANVEYVPAPIDELTSGVYLP